MSLTDPTVCTHGWVERDRQGGLVRHHCYNCGITWLNVWRKR